MAIIINGRGRVGARVTTGGGAPSYDSDAQAFFTAAGVTDVTQMNAINQFYVDLKANSLFTKLHSFQFRFLGNATRNSYNGKNPAIFQHSYSSGWTFGSTGATPNGTSAYINSNYNFKTSSSINSSSFGVYFRTNNTTGTQIYGALGLGNLLIHNNLSNGNFVHGDVSTNINTYTASPTTKLLVSSRESASVHKIYRDGILLNTNTGTITDFPNVNFYFGARNNNGTPAFYTLLEETFSFQGDALSSTEVANLTASVNSLMTTLGINV